MYTILAEVRTEDLNRFLAVFTTDGLAKRARHGSLGAEVLAATAGESRLALRA